VAAKTVLEEGAKTAEAARLLSMASQQAECVFAQADISMLPKDVAPKTGTKSFWKNCGHLFQILERWQMGGAFMLTVGELTAHSLAKDGTQALLLKLLGEQLWQGWFGEPTNRVLDSSCVMPRQMLMFLYVALQQLREHYEQVEDTKASAATAFGILAENARKRLRLSA
jgi:hypothetical protein